MSNMFLSKLKILIVEDEPESRVHLKTILLEFGAIDVFEVPDGRTALTLLDNTPDLVDVILCDWNMPSMSGIQLLRQLRTAGVQTPFVMVTGRGDSQSVMEARNLGVAGYIRKPFTPAQVEVRLRIIAAQAKVA